VPGWELYVERQSILRHDRPMSGGELGCYLSHIKALRRFLETPQAYCVVLEDDVQLPSEFASTVTDILAVLEREKPDTWESVHLALNTKLYLRPLAKIGERTLSHSYYIPCGTPAILWSRRGALAFLDSPFAARIHGTVDRELRSYCARKGRSYVILPSACDRFDDMPSDIDAGENRWAQNPASVTSSVRSKIIRHFPDYVNAAVSSLLRRG
jgi:glycosyl transferase family 25